MEILLAYPSWFLAFCVLGGAIYSLALYFRDKKLKDWNIWWIRGLLASRFLLTALLIFLLLSPLIKYQFSDREKPILVIATDNSESVLYNKDSTFYKTTFPDALTQLKSELEKEYQVETYTFDSKVNNGFLPDFQGVETDVHSALEEAQVKFLNLNLGGVILLSDGLFNKGQNPVYKAESFPAPIYTVALGDTTIRKDLIISKTLFNSIAFLGNKFPVEIITRGRKAQGSAAVVTLSGKNGKIFERKITYNSNDQLDVSNVILEATEPGIMKFRIAISQIEGEITYANNYQDIYIEVIDGRQKILLLSEGPHPDMGAWYQVIAENKNYQAVVEDVSKFKGNIKDYSLIVFNQLPALTNSASSIINEAKNAQIPSVFILGNASNINAFSQLNLGLKITGNRSNSDDALAAYNAAFGLFTVDDATRNMLGKFPPLTSPFGTYEVSPQGTPLFFRKIGTVTTSSPLVVFFTQEEWKTAVIAGEGMWKWRMFDFKTNKNHTVFNTLISKIVQFLAVKEDKSYFRVNVSSEIPENEPVIIDAELYNASYELINEPEAEIDLVNGEKKVFPYTFSRVNNAYYLDAGLLAPGEYTYNASVTLEGKLYKKSGYFTVKPIEIESANTVADFGLMYAIANRSGGQMVEAKDMSQLVELIKTNDKIKPRILTRNELKDLIEFRWLFFLLLALVSLEWFIRKRQGTY